MEHVDLLYMRCRATNHKHPRQTWLGGGSLVGGRRIGDSAFRAASYKTYRLNERSNQLTEAYAVFAWGYDGQN